MRVTIINPDKSIGVDGEFYSVLPFIMDETIHAVQWYGEWGEVEYVVSLVNGKSHKPENTLITDFTPYEPLVVIWQQAKAEFELAIASAMQARTEAQSATETPVQTQGDVTP